MLSTFEKILLFQKVPIFKTLDIEGLKLLASFSEEVFFDRGELIFEKGDQGDALYVIASGKVKGFTGNREFFLESPSYFGEMAILSGEKRTATIEAVEDTTVISIDSKQFKEMILNFPYIVFPIIKVLCERLMS